MKYRIYRNKDGKYKIKYSYMCGLLYLDLKDEIEHIQTYEGKAYPFSNMHTVLFDDIIEAKERIIREKNKTKKKVKSDKWSWIGDY